MALAQLNPIMGDFAGNVELARQAHAQAEEQGADLLVFSELFVTGYPPEDLVLRPSFQAQARQAVEDIAKLTKKGPAILVGSPWVDEGKLYNGVLLL